MRINLDFIPGNKHRCERGKIPLVCERFVRYSKSRFPNVVLASMRIKAGIPSNARAVETVGRRPLGIEGAVCSFAFARIIFVTMARAAPEHRHSSDRLAKLFTFSLSRQESSALQGFRWIRDLYPFARQQ